MSSYIECDTRKCPSFAKYDGTWEGYSAQREVMIAMDWWFDYAGCYCPPCHRKFNKKPNPLWNETLAPNLPGLTDSALTAIFGKRR